MNADTAEFNGRGSRGSAYEVLLDQAAELLRTGDQSGFEQLIAANPEQGDKLVRMAPTLMAMAALDTDSLSGDRQIATDTPAANSSEDSRTLGDFRILRELGRGGMGTVYEAEQISMGRRVALKVLPFAALANSKSLQRFHNEVRAAAALAHPHVVTVYSVGEERGIHYYAMQLIRGQSLAHLIAQLREERLGEARQAGEDVSALVAPNYNPDATTKAKLAGSASTILSRRGRERYRSAARLARDAAEALQHAHDQGVVHRDIKPGNLLLDAEGELYVADFGLARIEADAGVTMTGDIIGTLRYMAPEQALAKRVVIDHRVDIYSMGATLYELLTLEPVFTGEDRSELLKKIAFDDPKPPRSIDRDIPPDLETIVLKTLEKCPEDRYHTVQELADDLRAFSEDRPIAARRPSLAMHFRKAVLRNPQLSIVSVTAVCLIALAATIATAITTRAYTNESEQRQIAEQATNKAKNERAYAEQALAAREDSLRNARRNLYQAHIRESQEAIDRGNTTHAESLLYQYLPNKGAYDQRGWEWYFLVGQLDGGSEIIGRHPLQVRSVSFSPDGKQIASLDGHCVRLWDATTRSLINELRVPFDQLRKMAFSPDGGRIAVVSKLGVVRVWEPTNNLVTTRSPPEPHLHYCLAWSPDGKQIATGGTGRVYLWSVGATESPRVIRYPEDLSSSSAAEIAWRPSGDELALGIEGKLCILESVSGEVRLRTEPHHHDLFSIQWMSDGTRIATGSFDQWVKIIDSNSGEVLQELSHPAGVNCARFSPDEKRLACGTTGQEIYVWDVETGEALKRLTGHRGQVQQVDWTNDGLSLLSGASDGSVRMWPVETSSILEEHPIAVAIHPERHLGVLKQEAATGKLLHVFDYDANQTLFEVPGEKAFWSADGDSLATILGRTVRVFERRSKRLSSHFELSDGERVLSLSPDFSSVATLVRQSNTVAIRSTQGGERAFICSHPPIHPRAYWSPSGQWVALVGGEGKGKLQVWDSASGVQVWESVYAMEHEFGDVKWSPNGARLAAECDDGRIVLYEADSGRVLHSLSAQPPGRWIRGVAWSSDGRLLANGGWDQTVKVFDAEKGELLQLLEGHNASTGSLAFNPSNTRLATSDWGNTIKIWDVAVGEELMTLHSQAQMGKGDLFWSHGGRVITYAEHPRREREFLYDVYDSRLKIFDAGPGYQKEESGELSADVARRLFSRGMRLASSLKLDESDHAFAQAEQLVGVQPEKRLSRASLLEVLHTPNTVQEDLEIAFRAAPENQIVRCRLGWLLANRDDEELRDPERALAIAQSLVSDDPTEGEFWTLLALAQYRTGDYEAARRSSLRALDREQYRRTTPYLVLTLALKRLGHFEEADYAVECANRACFDESNYKTYADRWNTLGQEGNAIKSSEGDAADGPWPLLNKLGGRTWELPFDNESGGVQDVKGKSVGFGTRLPGTSDRENDSLLAIDKLGRSLQITSSAGDFNKAVNLENLSIPAVRLSSLGYSAEDDFEVRALFAPLSKVKHTDQWDQFGVFAGRDGKHLTRAGIIFRSQQPEVFSVHTSDGVDVNARIGGHRVPDTTDIEVIIRRLGGQWYYWVDGQLCLPNTTQIFHEKKPLDPTGAQGSPDLNAEDDLYVGVFALSPLRNRPMTVAVKEFEVVVLPREKREAIFAE